MIEEMSVIRKTLRALPLKNHDGAALLKKA